MDEYRIIGKRVTPQRIFGLFNSLANQPGFSGDFSGGSYRVCSEESLVSFSTRDEIIRFEGPKIDDVKGPFEKALSTKKFRLKERK